MRNTDLYKVAKQLVDGGRGILAADESTGTIGKRFSNIGVENIEPNRADWREIMFTASDIEKYISGVITYEETLYQDGSDGRSFVDLLSSKGVIVGIKVDRSTKPLPFTTDEVLTEGLDGLRERFAKYYERGARFAKWRAVIKIGDGIPTNNAVQVNTNALAIYAALSQEAGLVPIVEPEVLMDGEHSIDVCYDVTQRVLEETFQELARKSVDLSGIVLKPNMVVSALDSSVQAAPAEVAEKTVECLRNTVPQTVPGIAFLSGGQSSNQAIVNLDAINKYAKSVNAPWSLTFSYGRALQADALSEWSGVKGNVPRAQATFLDIAKSTSLASSGRYTA